MARTLYITHYVLTAINEHSKKTQIIYFASREKGKEISDIMKNYDYSSFHLSSTREKKHASRSYLFLKGKSQRKIGKLKKDIFYGSQVFPLYYFSI